MDAQKKKRAIELARELLELLDEEGEGAPPTKDPKWFRDTGHLNDAGIEYVEKLFDEGKTPYFVSKALGISYRAASERQKSWHKRRAD